MRQVLPGSYVGGHPIQDAEQCAQIGPDGERRFGPDRLEPQSPRGSALARCRAGGTILPARTRHPSAAAFRGQ